MNRLQNKTALVTGGASGIGFGTAKRMLEEGATVYITDLDQARIDSAVERLGTSARGLVADATSRNAMQNVVDTVKTERGTLDIVFANAGAA